MIGNIINTVSTRITLAVLSIVLLILNSNFLGSEGVGLAGILILEVAVYLLISNLICGGSLIYYASRKNQNQLLFTAYVWMLISGALFYFLISYVPYIQSEFAKDVFFLGLLQSGVGTHVNLLAGREKIKQLNLVNLIQVIVQIGVLCIFYFAFRETTVQAFIDSTYIAYGSAFLLSLFFTLPQLEKAFSFPHLSLFRELIHYGFYAQIANISQLLNYRLSYFLLNYFSGAASVGRFIAGVQISEGILLPSKSISTVQYAKVSNIKQYKQAALLTVKLLKLTFLLSVPLVVVLMLIPSSIYASLLSEDFNRTSEVISLMAIGIVALSGEMILSTFFSGTGQQKVNARSSSLGLLVTLVVGFSLIPNYGIVGAALTSSLSFLSIFIYLFTQVLSKTTLSWRDFLFRKEDVIFLKRLVRFVRSRS